MGSRTINVLLVSQDRGLLRCLGKLLRICGCEVCQVGNSQAPAALEAGAPDFLILDAHPNLDDALQISRSQAARRARGEVYTLLWTSAVSVHELHKALEAGIDDFLAKPVVYGELLARLRVGARELELERRFGEQAGFDPLTGLPNLRALQGRLKRQLSSPGTGKTPLGACLLMEIDFFQRVIRQFGNSAGESLLKCAAAKLRELAGESAFLASFGEGRFALLSSKLTVAEAAAWANSLRQAWAETEVVAGELRLHFTASFGVGGPLADGSLTADDVLRRSTEALELAKASGGDFVVSYGEFDDQDEAWSSFAGPGKLFEGAVARDVMTSLPGVLRTDELAGDAVSMLHRSQLAALPVVDDEGKLAGIVTEDYASDDQSAKATASLTVGQVMNHKVLCLDENASFAELIESFTQETATPIVITHEGRPTGLVMPENLVLLGQKLPTGSMPATVPFSPHSDYLIVPDLVPVETA